MVRPGPDISPAVNVSQQLSRYDGEWVHLETLSLPSRRVIITDHLKGTLRAWRLESRYSLDGHPVFPRPRGSIARIQYGQRLPGDHQAGWPGFQYDVPLLRHARGLQLASLGWPLADIEEELGDSIETVQAVYMHAYDARQREAENSGPAWQRSWQHRTATGRPSSTLSAP